MTRKIRTRIAPSPTGFLHLGTARTALFSWAFARHHGGDFILRIEDTDVARSTQEAVDQIIAAMQWLQLGYEEGPFYQMQRLERYRAVIAQMLADGTAYHCYCQPAELDAMREAQAIGAAFGIPIDQAPEERHAVTRKLGSFKTSMLHDAQAGRPLEIDALLGAVHEIGRRLPMPTPNIDALLGLVRLMARERGLYPGPPLS